MYSKLLQVALIGVINLPAHGQDALFSVNKALIVKLSTFHVRTMMPEVDISELKFRGLAYINRPQSEGGDHLQAEFCWGTAVRTKHDTFDIFRLKSNDTGYFKIVTVDANTDGTVSNAKIHKMPLASAVAGEPCLATSDRQPDVALR